MSALPDPGDMADLFRRLAAGEPAAFGQIAARLWDRLRPTARRRLKQEPELASVYDEEDAIQSGLCAMWRGILAGTIAPCDGVDDFLRLARTIVLRRIVARARAERAAKRNPTPNGEHDWASGPSPRGYAPDDLSLYECGLPAPDASLIAREESEWLLSVVDPVVRDIAEARIQGLTVAQIAWKRRMSPRTIATLLREIEQDLIRALRKRDA